MRKLLAVSLLLFALTAGASNDGVTRLGVSGGPAIPYGSFAGKVDAPEPGIGGGSSRYGGRLYRGLRIIVD